MVLIKLTPIFVYTGNSFFLSELLPSSSVFSWKKMRVGGWVRRFRNDSSHDHFPKNTVFILELRQVALWSPKAPIFPPTETKLYCPTFYFFMWTKKIVCELPVTGDVIPQGRFLQRTSPRGFHSPGIS